MNRNDLKKYPNILSTDLLKKLYDLGCSDKIIYKDASNGNDAANFKHSLKGDGLTLIDIFDNTLEYFQESPSRLLEKKNPSVRMDSSHTPILWNSASNSYIKQNIQKAEAIIDESFHSYDVIETSCVVTTTGENSQYTNVLLTRARM